MKEVEQLCTKISIIEHGKVIAEGSNEELKSLVTDKNTIEITAVNIALVKKQDLLKLFFYHPIIHKQ